MKKIVLIIFAVIQVGSLKAQVVYDYLKAADEYFNKADYFSAAKYYEKYLDMGKAKAIQAGYSPYVAQAGTTKKDNSKLSTREQAIYNLAESYRLLHFHVKAEPVYAEAVKFDKSRFPLVRYRYATTLRALEKYPEADAAFRQFLEEYPVADKYREDASREIANLQFIKEQQERQDLKLYKVAKTGGEVPDSGAVYAPVLFNNNIYFTSTKAEKGVPRLQVHNNRVYQATYQDGMITNVSKVTLPELKDIQQGVISFTPDGNTIYLTRWTLSDGTKSSSLYRSTKTSGSWSDPEPLSSVINVSGYNSQQAFVMPDGKHMIFSSDQPGGYGGFDLWSAALDANGNAGTPVNLGNGINTAGDEQAPYYHAPSRTLVFSSNGRVGMGGYDFFYVKGDIRNWSAPVNFGFPVNSAKDDIYFASRGTANNVLQDVLFSSDRNDVCCLELFSLQKARLPREVKGTVVACEDKRPMAGVAVTIMDTINNKTITSKVTDASGQYSFVIDDYQPLKAVAAAQGYYSASLDFNAPADENQLLLSNPDICLAVIEIEKPVVLENVLYDFNKADLKPQYYPEVDKIVAMFKSNPGIVIELSSHTDNIGSDEYNQKLSQARAQSVVNYLVRKGINRNQIITKGYGESQPVAPNEHEDGTDNPEGRQMNRRTEFKVLKN